MALLPNMYQPLITPEMFNQFGFGPENMGGPLFIGSLMDAVAAGGVRPSPTAPATMQAPLVPSTPMPAMDLSALANLNINPMFIGTGLGGAPTSQALDLLIDPATGLRLNKQRTVELDETGRVAREITPEGSTPGVYFKDDRGMSATTGLGKDTRFTPLDPNAVYTAINERTGEVVSEGVGAEGMKAAQAATAKLSEVGRKADWAVVKTDPTTGATSAVANVDPRQSALGEFADLALPLALGLAVPGLGLVGSKVLGAGLGAAGGSALSSVAQGRSLEETLKRAAISGVVTAAGAGVGGKLGTAFNKTAASVIEPVAGGSLAAGALGAGTMAAKGASMAGLLPGIVVSGPAAAAGGISAGALAGGLTAGAVGAQLAGFGPSGAYQGPPQQTPPEGSIEVTGESIPPPPSTIPGVVGSVAGSAASNVFNDPTGGNQIIAEQPRTTQQEFDAAFPAAAIGSVAPDVITTVGNDIEVTAPRKIEPVQEDPLSLPLPPLSTIPTTAGGQFGSDRTLEAEEKKSLLDEIIKYYSLGSGALDLLGGAFGGGGGGGRMTPYASQLGAMPSFTRGAFTPFAGDYETYGFGPEFNFFGGAPTPTPSAPDFGLLPPAAQPGFLLA